MYTHTERENVEKNEFTTSPKFYVNIETNCEYNLSRILKFDLKTTNLVRLTYGDVKFSIT